MNWTENEQRIAQFMKWAILRMGCNIYKKDKFVPVLKDHAMKTYGSGVKLNAVSTSSLDGGELSVSHSCRFIPFDTHWIGQ
jgi:hypothetical protein